MQDIRAAAAAADDDDDDDDGVEIDGVEIDGVDDRVVEGIEGNRRAKPCFAGGGRGNASFI